MERKKERKSKKEGKKTFCNFIGKKHPTDNRTAQKQWQYKIFNSLSFLYFSLLLFELTDDCRPRDPPTKPLIQKQTKSNYQFLFQLMHHNFTFINKVPLHVSGTYVPIFRRTDYTYTATGSTSSLMTTVWLVAIQSS